jgi:hypothetical protein
LRSRRRSGEKQDREAESGHARATPRNRDRIPRGPGRTGTTRRMYPSSSRTVGCRNRAAAAVVVLTDSRPGQWPDPDHPGNGVSSPRPAGPAAPARNGAKVAEARVPMQRRYRLTPPCEAAYPPLPGPDITRAPGARRASNRKTIT